MKDIGGFDVPPRVLKELLGGCRAQPMRLQQDDARRDSMGAGQRKVLVVRDDDALLVYRTPPDVIIRRADQRRLPDDEDVVTLRLQKETDGDRNVLIQEEA